LRKNGQDFWRIWKLKFENNNKTSVATQVDGIADSEVIALNFANYFQSNCKPFNHRCNAELKLKYDTASD